MEKPKENMTHINDNLIRHELALLHEFLGLLPILRASSYLRPQQISGGDVHQTELQMIRKMLTGLLPSSALSVHITEGM